MTLQWSPGDLGRQRLVVRRIAEHAEVDRRRFDDVRGAYIAKLRHMLGTPLGLAGCFVAGMVLGAGRSRRRDSSGDSGGAHRGGRMRQLLATAFWLVQARVKRQAQSAEPPAVRPSTTGEPLIVEAPTAP
jgi:hypothetical protein